ncbi:MAG: hypothetical protein RLZZ102_583 [Pseudomonadota bacterium]|jgi:hypothetical protein
MSVKDEIEDYFFMFLMTLPYAERKEIWNGNDCMNALTNDAEEDLKEEAWKLIKYSLNYSSIVERLKEQMKEEQEEEQEEEEEVEDQNLSIYELSSQEE